jgi:hypothetical protein
MPVTIGGPEDIDAMRGAVALTRAMLDRDDEARFAVMRGADTALLCFHLAQMCAAILRQAVDGDLATARADLDAMARRMLACEAGQEPAP